MGQPRGWPISIEVHSIEEYAMDFLTNWGWTIFGPLVLLCVIAFGVLTRRHLRRSERQRQDAAVDTNYDERLGNRPGMRQTPR